VSRRDFIGPKRDLGIFSAKTSDHPCYEGFPTSSDEFYDLSVRRPVSWNNGSP